MTPKRIYIDFGTPIEEWADANKGMIMDSIYSNVFDFIESEEDDRVVLQVSPKIPQRKRPVLSKEPPINVDFIISKDDIDYYIEVEEYERCAEIHKLQNPKIKPKKESYW
jgi:hypothetical protein